MLASGSLLILPGLTPWAAFSLRVGWALDSVGMAGSAEHLCLCGPSSNMDDDVSIVASGFQESGRWKPQDLLASQVV